MKKLSLSLFSIILFSSIITSAISFEKIIIGKANVTDGDTIKINDQKIRLFGIDAPETQQFCKEVYLSFLIFNFKRDYKCGEKSTNALKKKIKNKKIRFLIQDKKDRYKTYIGICYLKRQDINSWLVKNGYAIAYRRYSKKYIIDEQYAEDNKLGIWQGTFMEPEKWRRIMN